MRSVVAGQEDPVSGALPGLPEEAESGTPSLMGLPSVIVKKDKSRLQKCQGWLGSRTFSFC
jgi:hypothetical protein